MTTFVLTRSENAKSAIKLGYPVTLDETDIPEGSKVVRWGNGTSPDRRGWSLVLNKSSVLEVSTNKVAALQKLRAAGVPTPDLFLAGQRTGSGRYVVRPASHAEGSDFDLRNGPFTVPAGMHATKFIEDTREYRVWFIRDKYLVAKRVPRTSEGQTSSDVCRSKWAYGEFVTIFPKLKEEVEKARLAIPLDFGAMDVLWKDASGGTPGSYYFLEINSAPSLDTPTVLNHFQTHLRAILGAPARREVVQAEQPVVRAADRQPDRPTGTIRRPDSPNMDPYRSYEAKLRLKMEQEKRDMEERIRKEVFGE